MRSQSPRTSLSLGCVAGWALVVCTGTRLLSGVDRTDSTKNSWISSLNPLGDALFFAGLDVVWSATPKTTPWLGCFRPRLTTIELPKYELGENAIRVLLERIQRKRTTRITVNLSHQLRVRESCDAAREESWSRLGSGTSSCNSHNLARSRFFCSPIPKSDRFRQGNIDEPGFYLGWISPQIDTDWRTLGLARRNVKTSLMSRTLDNFPKD